VQKEAFIKDGDHECCEIIHHWNTVYTLDQTVFYIHWDDIFLDSAHIFIGPSRTLYVSLWPGLPSRVLFHLFWILSTCLGELEWFFCIKLQHITSPTVEIVLTGAGFSCLLELKLRYLMFCLPLVPGGITLFGGHPTKHPNLLIPHTSAVEYFLCKWFMCS